MRDVLRGRARPVKSYVYIPRSWVSITCSLSQGKERTDYDETFFFVLYMRGKILSFELSYFFGKENGG